VPAQYPTSTIFVDESGSRASGSRFFVMGAVKTREPSRLGREMKAVRDRTGFGHEFKFSEINQGNITAYYEALDVLAASDARIIASVVNKDVHDPFPGVKAWDAHASVAAQLLVGAINRRELVTVVLDELSTPEDIYLGDMIRRKVNARFKCTSVISAITADSKSMDTLQLADLVAGAIAFERRRQAGENRKVGSNPNSPKSRVALRLLSNFGLTNIDDSRSDRVNIATVRAPQRLDRPLRLLRTTGTED
jgi:hypothetical protein